MRKIIFICFVALFVSGGSLIAQNITAHPDSIPSLLCKKWEVDYAIVGGIKIGRTPDAPEMNFEFNKDKTLIMTSSDPKDNIKGTWVYEPKGKVIKIKIKVTGASDLTIVSLKEDELRILADTKSATPDDPMAMTLVYKIKTQ